MTSIRCRTKSRHFNVRHCFVFGRIVWPNIFVKKKKKTRTRSRNSTTKAVRIGLKFSHESRSNSSDRSPSPGARKTSNFDFCFLETNSAIAGDLKSSCNVRSVRNTIRVGSNFLLGMIGARTRLSPNNRFIPGKMRKRYSSHDRGGRGST